MSTLLALRRISHVPQNRALANVLLRQVPAATTMTASGRNFGNFMSSKKADDSSETLPKIKEERPRRCLLSVPGSSLRKIEKAQTTTADCIVLDLEDGVPLDQKDAAREIVAEALQTKDFGTAEVCVRINALDTGDMARADLHAILSSPNNLQAIVIPKVECSYSTNFVSDTIDALAAGADVRILAAIESAQGMMNIGDIASSAKDKLDALIFASEDYCADLELIRTEHATELLYARSKLVLTAKAFQLQAIDMVHIDYRNMVGLNVECQRGREMGFNGKQAIHPDQVATIQKAFLPSEKDVAFALEIVQHYEETTAAGGEGKGACVVRGIVVDAPVYKWALKILKRAGNAGMLDDAAQTA